MTEQAAVEAPALDGQPQQAENAPQEGGEQQTPKTYDEDYVKGLRSEAAKYRNENKALKTQVSAAEQATMSESEKAAAQARQEGRAEATAEFSKRLARTQFDALAGRRNAAVNTEDVLEFVDLAKFVDDNGELDEKAIQAAVEKLVPEAQAGTQSPPSFDSGTRTTPPQGQTFGDTIRKQLGH